MNGKKAQIPEAVIVLAALIIVVQAFFAVASHQQFVTESFSPPNELIDFYYIFEIEEFLDKDAARLAIQISYAKAASKPAVKDASVCKSVGAVSIWTDNCAPSNAKIKDSFLQEVSEQFKIIADKKKFKVSSEGDQVKFLSAELKPRTKFSKGKAIYDIAYKFQPTFSLKYPDLDFEKVYGLAIGRKEFCKNDPLAFGTCMNGLVVKDWEVSSSLQASYIIFTLKSDKSYFYDGEFKPVEMKFAIEQIS